ncbi:cryptochrome/photolyase family protein [Methylomonas fluvii]|uniref:Deoxyribodipyrimidine photo-lyase n=1 Tax=Methylomonas fluvii TaxID=1854564 RepID=A0ABR9DDK2_9GAMM|nr:deoxyribodipyrimidine photo-lyase [Methylomonas fluvii]MBD9361045.1 deoxyribodipyrimidine photo-lyase [Methylomonas fluvii]CAD6873944.1 Deoxyribodipyrimidine photolyase (EC 4.1.99.3) [Methylomonas fluvii]
MAKKRYKTSLFIFRRDLRLDDNTALNAALNDSRQVIACFIFDPRQIQTHPYQSTPGLQFMLESLSDLQQQLQQQGALLYIFNDQPAHLLAPLKQDLGIEAVFVNRDYSPFSRQRDNELREQCETLHLAFHSQADLLLTEPEQGLRSNGKPYQVFTAFHRQARLQPVSAPQRLAPGKLSATAYAGHKPELLQQLQQPHQNALPGGRQAALARLAIIGSCKNYLAVRDFPAMAATSQLSAYSKFGCCSVREIFYSIQAELDPDHPLLRQLYWRDFFTHIGFHFPHVFGHAFDRRYDGLLWRNGQDDFWAWANGQTGFPIVDAAMRELNQTGWMHNRLRMIVASFLVKDLHVSWRWGERYFAQRLLDYDPCVNNGNWQWAASTGCDAQPYFRIFNPWLQQKKFDPQCVYIKTWIPELQRFPTEVIHKWEKHPQSGDYPRPRVDHGAQSQLIKAQFKALGNTTATEE